MARVHVTVAADGSFAEGNASPGDAADAAEVRGALTRAGVRHGVDERELAAFAARLADPGFAGSCVLARATAAVPGEDGRVECTPMPRLLPGRVHADGTIDYHERARLVPIAAAQPLGHIVPPTPGVAGTDVLGRRLAATPGRPHAVRLGAGVLQVDNRLVAARGGVLLRDERQLDVVPLWTHAGDVDAASGNLHSEGSLEIRGDVRAGFAVTAGGDVLVGGTIEAAAVTAGGSVTVARGVLGRGSHVRAGGAIACWHATSARLEADLAVEVGDQVANCTVVGERIHLRQGRGAAVGGELRARHRIELNTAGAEDGAPTLLAVADLTDEQVDHVRRTGAGQRLERRAVRLRVDGRAGGKLMRAAVRSADEARDERLRLLQRQRELLRGASVEIAGTAHAGVRIRFGTRTLQLDAVRSNVRFTWDPDHDDIREETLR